MKMLSNVNTIIQDRFEIRKAELVRPFFWLGRGWQDLWKNPSASIAHGVMVAMMGAVILLFASSHIYMIATVISGFLLAGPFMSIGLCELSRQQENEQSLSFDDSLSVLASNRVPLGNFSTTLLVISVLWFTLSGLVLFAFFGDIAPSIKDSLWDDFMYMVSPEQVLLYIVVGSILACIVFALSVVSIPAIIDSHVQALDAMLLSIHVVVCNFPVMIIWAALIVILTAIGFLSYLLGMVIIYPLLGHATWHAYRDLVEIKE